MSSNLLASKFYFSFAIFFSDYLSFDFFRCTVQKSLAARGFLCESDGERDSFSCGNIKLRRRVACATISQSSNGLSVNFVVIPGVYHRWCGPRV